MIVACLVNVGIFTLSWRELRKHITCYVSCPLCFYCQAHQNRETHHLAAAGPGCRMFHIRVMLNVQNASRECEHAVAVRCSTIEEIGLLKTSSVHVGDIL